MRFGAVLVDEAEGAILAHAVMVGDLRLRKSHVVTADDIDALRKAGVVDIAAATLEPGDLGEDAAAARIADALRAPLLDVKPAATGRVNIHARKAGVFSVDKASIDAINRVDPAMTVATLANHVAVMEGQMVATVKIIPFAVAVEWVDRVVRLAVGEQVLALHAFQPARVGLIQTILTATKPSVLDKTTRTTAARLARSGSSIEEERRVKHETGALAVEIGGMAKRRDMVIVFGASAMSDPDDVVPAAIRQAGGVVHRAGMPVDPGNLIVLGELAGKPVLGAPGCARSPKENGFDWVLDRLLSGIGVTSDDIAGMGVGGLLMEIPTRPQPRELARKAGTLHVHATVLAAGRSSRMGGPNKLLAEFGGQRLIRRTVERVRASTASGVTVVTGHQAARVVEAVKGLELDVVHNEDFASGLASSLKAGLAAAPSGADALLVMLGDMPDVTSADLDRLMSAFREAGGTPAVRATHGGKRGNPVLIPRSLFPRIATLEGDTGARHLLEAGDVEVIDVEIGPAASIDVDTPEAMERAGGVLQG